MNKVHGDMGRAFAAHVRPRRLNLHQFAAQANRYVPTNAHARA